MTTGEDRSKDRFKNGKLSVSQPRSNKAQEKLRLLYQSVCIHLFVPTSVTCEYHPEALECLHLLQCISARLQNTLLWAS